MDSLFKFTESPLFTNKGTSRVVRQELVEVGYSIMYYTFC